MVMLAIFLNIASIHQKFTTDNYNHGALYHTYIFKFWCKLCFFQGVFSKMQLQSLKDKSMIWWTIKPATNAAGLNVYSNLGNKTVLWISVVE